MAKAIEVAKYIVKSIPVDNLKLQKLLYYSQGTYLVLNEGKTLFPENIEAWDYGPVVPEVYREYKAFGFDTITPSEEPSTLSIEDMHAVDLALAAVGDMSGTELITQTHRESPWKNNYKPGRPSQIIPVDDMYKYFKANLEFTPDETKPI
jgi:uncharacterized phage-associated protein